MSSIYNKNYVNVTYKEKNNNYPLLFCNKIFANYSNCKVLDIGCGDGTITKILMDKGFDTYGIDFSEKSKKILGERYQKVDIQKDIYPFEDETFDIVFSKSVIEHLREPDFLLKESYRILKPGGIIITLTPSWKHSYREQFFIDHTHVTPFTKHSLKTIHELEMFEEIKCDYFYQLPILWKYPKLKIFSDLVRFLRIPYRPFYDCGWSEKTNKYIRFSQEIMLLCVAKRK